MRINLETAKLAKEKGYDESCSSVFVDGNPKELGEVQRRNSTYQNQITRPTQSDLQKWLREVHDIQVIVIPFASDSTNENSNTVYCFLINKKHFYAFVNKDYEQEFDSCEDALEHGLQEGLKEIKQDEGRS